MKKFLILIITIVLFSFSLFGCNKKEDNIIRVNEVTDSIFYAPFYVGIENGFFEEQGLKIELTNGSGSDVSMTAVLSKSADIALLGPETAVYIARQNKQDKPLVFGQLTKRDGCFLISRTNEQNFTFDNLKNKEVIIGRQGGLPAMTFEYTVNSMGIFDGQNITLRKDIQFGLMAPSFENGTGDYVTLFEPTASEFVSLQKGYIVASVGEYSGEVPYTGFVALQSYMKNNSDKIDKFLTAMYKALDYVYSSDINDVANVLKKHFKTTDIELIKSSLTRYKNADTWVKNMSMTQSSFDRLISIINNAGEDTTNITFDMVVDNSYSDKIYNSLYSKG